MGNKTTLILKSLNLQQGEATKSRRKRRIELEMEKKSRPRNLSLENRKRGVRRRL
jgi:hypothetical protein